ncbi:MAG: GerAB/ArcD/ProY family transporter [Clostridia bacterium]|nr:GerAB/ArcD/ProY family transporter [Clostridia bacterium]MDD4375667.1 GerAB/ArcD/ProY family transporter [Clostridia bacterium]
MDKIDDKISIRQLYIVWIVGICSELIKIVPKYSSMFARQATWVSSIISIIPISLMIFIFYKIMRKGKDDSLAESFERILGSVFGKALTFIYLLVTILSLSIRLRYLAEKCSAALYIGAEIEFFLISTIFVAYIIARGKLQYFGRFTEIIWIPLIIFVIGILVTSMNNIDIKNLYPVTVYEAKDVFMGVLPILSVILYFPLALFLGNRVTEKKEMLKVGLKKSIMIIIFSVAIVLTTIGAFGYGLTQNLSMPYFTAIKNIDLFSIVERMEAIGITFWIVTDFVLIILLTFVAITLIQGLFKLNSQRVMVTPVLFVSYIMSLIIANSIFELEIYSKGIGSLLDLAFGIVIPIMIFSIGKIRRKI